MSEQQEHMAIIGVQTVIDIGFEGW